MIAKLLRLLLCLSSVIADKLSGEFSGDSEPPTEYPEYHEDALLSPDTSENSTVQLLDLWKMPIGSDADELPSCYILFLLIRFEKVKIFLTSYF
ncbi:hypothetical protein B9Z55_025683 [Caenorhabditis nigoni]|uniref:Uncharacterized protein n=1 Tax=Caenorhabditis nigoni TaxID=1611254 RepID=A0A2G5SZP2_9PELO|nr:hypothetical protein B9Z55_025683 [Caenorhabditis nigoni]